MTVGFLYGAGPEDLNFGDKSLRRKNQSTSREKPKNGCIPRKPIKTEVQVSGAKIQTLARDSRPAVWVSTAERKSF